MNNPLSEYQSKTAFDEMFFKNKVVRESHKSLKENIEGLGSEDLDSRQDLIDKSMMKMGITFNVYHDMRGTERIFPLNVIPRVIPFSEWKVIEEGLQQRIKALNLFIQDIYNDQKILKDGKIPSEYILNSSTFLKECMGITPAKSIWCHITGTDLIRDENGDFVVLEDNLRCPSGVAYMLENREIMKRVYSTFFEKSNILPISEYPDHLLSMLRYLSDVDNPTVAILSPGIYNSAYFEHSFLARKLGVPLVQASDLVIKDNKVYMKTIKELKRVHVIYRRIDDAYLDPLTFNPDSLLGVPGLFKSFRDGNVALVNAPGTGIADDKLIYTFVPEFIRYYLNEEPKLKNVKTYNCTDKTDLKYVIENLPKLVVKAVNEAGGYGMLVGPASTKEEQAEFKDKILDDPRNYIAQPVVNFSTSPSYVDGKLGARHVDLRPYIIYGEEIKIVPGGLSRVALKENSLVVNSSQGGGSKDTWIIK
ncbi:hypothetical protein DID80_06345 [Candidatus Marinamargulisbacteria bacterium SCGC AAA071-K20]|nr:hypothetical protein DID80_06345 [Candidatus Marinamargulisbacteria bacterium SCGC AAA071-K20]